MRQPARRRAGRGATTPDAASADPPAPVKWRARYQMFRGTLATWEELFNDAAEFATETGPARVINISHSSDGGDGVVAVWYWAEDKNEEPPASGR